MTQAKQNASYYTVHTLYYRTCITTPHPHLKVGKPQEKGSLLAWADKSVTENVSPNES